MYLLGIDFGTGGGKAVIINEKADVLGYGFEEYEIFTEKPGWSEHNASEYWNVACRVIKNALSQSKIDPSGIKGIAVSSALPSMVMVGKDGEPVARSYNLMDRRAVKQVEEVKEKIGEDRVFAISKNRLDDHPIIVNLLWEKENRPEIFSKIYKVLTIDGYIASKLTGEYTCHFSGAPFYGVAYNLEKETFDSDILKELNIPENIFPKLFASENIIGSVFSSAAEESGLVPGIPVAAGQVDCNAGWVGAGAIGIGACQMNLGTAGNFGIVHDGSYFDPAMINFAYTTKSNKEFVTVPTTTTGGQLIRYMRDNFYMAEKESEEKTGIDTYDIINEEAVIIPPGSEGLIMLPYLMGERTPIWDVHARGTLFGLSLNHTRGHVVRAMMEAVAYALYDSYSILKKSGMSITPPLILNEGGAKSKLWRQIITDVFNIPTALVKNRTGAPYGDAILAGVATGVFNDYSIAREKAHYIDPMEPDRVNHEMCMEYFKLYKSLYEHVKDDYKTLAHLREKFNYRSDK
ncbi:MAG: FGGY-family carbohydrate kinase [Spirochaetaceae bacterium]|nr:FGGY-family carbohydrate kinase [Spirochaetaceae bacterium]